MKGIMKFLKDLDHKIENQGDKLVITISGDKEKLTKAEKTLKAMHDLHEAMGDDCCGGKDGHCC